MKPTPVPAQEPRLLLLSADGHWSEAVRQAVRRLQGCRLEEASSAEDALTRLIVAGQTYTHLLVEPGSAGPLFEDLVAMTTEESGSSILVVLGPRDAPASATFATVPRHEAVIEALTVRPTPPATGAALTPPALRAALREDMIRTRYQPILRIDDLCPVGIEVLARMHHPELGIVSPDHFVPHFEASGLARRLTETILARAMPEIADIVRQTGLLISVNLPLPAFLDMETPAMLNGLCTRIGIPHARVLVELTESFPVEDMPGLRVAAERWRAQGYGTALDDVGPLVPRWRELIELPFTVLKLDLSMTKPSQHAAATEIIAASRARGLTVVAEGVSDEANLRRLQALGAQAVQSFLLARPMPARALPLWLRMVHASGHAGLLPGKTPSAGRQET